MKKKDVYIVFCSIILFALASPIVKLISENGGKFGIENPGAVSFCNLLFVGNFCAGIIVLVSFGMKQVFIEIISTTPKGRILLLVNSVLAALYPGLVFTALENTSVTNVVLLARFESIFYGFIAWMIYKTALNRNEIIGFVVIGVGVLGLVYVKEMYMFRGGDMIVVGAAAIYAIAVVMSKEALKLFSVGAFLFARNFFSAVLFFFLAIYLYDVDHFIDAFEGSLWRLMAIYALVIIVVGQFLWYKGLKTVEASVVSNLTLLHPFLTLLFAFLLLGEAPDIYQTTAIVIILMGMLIAKIKVKSKDNEMLQVDKSLSGG